MRSIVVAYDRQRGIGANGRPLWESGLLPADSRHFRFLTANSSVIMGRTSFETFHGKLPGRQNIVVTRRERLSEGVTMVHSLEEAFKAATSKDINVIGGASIFEQAVFTVDRIYATEVDSVFSNADAFFPELDRLTWREIRREDHSADGPSAYNYSFVTYERTQPRRQLDP